MFSLESYGITYSNRRDDQEIWPFPKTKSVNIHILSLIQFYQSPMVKFSFAAVSRYIQKAIYELILLFQLHYLFLLLLFSYVLLFKFNPSTSETPSIDWTEILLIILISFMLISEIRSVSKRFFFVLYIILSSVVLGHRQHNCQRIPFYYILSIPYSYVLRFILCGSHSTLCANRIRWKLFLGQVSIRIL